MIPTGADTSTGLPELDNLLRGLMPGDNVVWQVESIEDYLSFVDPFARQATAAGKRVIYFRFARHKPLLPDDIKAEVCDLDPQIGFEGFLDKIHKTIEQAGRGVFYVFDCLSDLAVDWVSDQMLGNFFRLTCPFLYDLETIAYFALLRNYHSFHANNPIRETTQLLLDVYRHEGSIYLRVLKLQFRHSSTMDMLHVWRNGTIELVTDSCTISRVLSSTPRSALESAIDRLDVWNRTFLQAEESLKDAGSERVTETRHTETFQRLLRMVVSRDERVLDLCMRHFDISDVLTMGKRTIGTGLIGGKSVGMLLARAILMRSSPRWMDILEIHDSFYVGSDVFYTFLVRNGCWWLRRSQRDPATFMKDVAQARRRILNGTFPEEIRQRFSEMLEYFGQSPIIVRSSSLLEDNFGNSFAGKYDSVFLANQGSIQQRLENFIAAVKEVYASSMSEAALSYRARNGLLDQDEQMAILVQRVSGSHHNTLFYPHLGGVAFSLNPYVWSETIDPHAGLLRLVFGLGTRAVDRCDDDYTRIVALNAPERRPETVRSDLQGYSQHKVDVLDLVENRLVTIDFEDLLQLQPDVPLDLFASVDARLERMARQGDLRAAPSPCLTFDSLFSETSLIEDVREMLRILEEAYDYPVDVELTANFNNGNAYHLNLVQCRPLQVKGPSSVEELPGGISGNDILLESSGPVLGPGRIVSIDRIIYVPPYSYSNLPVNKRYAVARLIGRLTNLEGKEEGKVLMLLGPGRWGTTTPSLGVPVSFPEIDRVSVLCEIAAMTADFAPDVSLATHFFSEMVEADMLYLALFPRRDDNLLNIPFFEETENKLTSLVPDAKDFEDLVRVIDASDLPEKTEIRLHADTVKQHVLCYFERRA